MASENTSPGTQPALPPAESERHASWLELFFDLIAVAGVAQLAHLLHGTPGAGDLGFYCLLYLAFWTAWMCFTTYGNVAADKVHTRTVLIGMFGLAVMAAAVPGVRTDHARAFALAYVLVRVLASRVWQHRGEVVADWPIAQLSVGVVPWLVSLWAEAPTRYWLWTAGLAVDLGLTFALSRNRILARAQEEWEERAAVHERETGPRPAAARFDARHLDERLGLFTLIVIGESVALTVEASSETERAEAPAGPWGPAGPWWSCRSSWAPSRAVGPRPSSCGRLWRWPAGPGCTRSWTRVVPSKALRRRELGAGSAGRASGGRHRDGAGDRTLRRTPVRMPTERDAVSVDERAAAEEVFRVRRGGGSARSPMDQLQRP
ncbi:low temperature requirement protein A [Streptomyces tanashiensis]